MDSDIICYKAGFSSQRTSYRFIYFNGQKIDYDKATLYEIKRDLKERGLTQKSGSLQKLIHPEPIEYALQRVKMLIESILDKTMSESYRAFLTSNDRSNFRFRLATIQEYKGNRKNSKKPIHYDAIRDYLVDFYHAEMIYNQEADDAMGIEQMKNLDNSIICTIDKDLDMIPGYHYNIDTQETYCAIDPGELHLDDHRHKVSGTGLLWFYAQMLLGDNADNIPGIPGYGPVKVFNVLKDAKEEKDMNTIVRAAYNSKYGDDYYEYFKEVGNLLWIRREEGQFKIN